jgi:hypothetical protein
MKIQIIKKGSVNAKPSSYCDVLLEDVPLNEKSR